MGAPELIRPVPSPPAGALAPGAVLRFERFELQPVQRRLLMDGVPVPLRARAFDVLIVLAERAGHLVSRSELLDRVWSGLVVEENNLNVQINALRKALGGEVVSTVPGRGYRFVLPVQIGKATMFPGAANEPTPDISPPSNLPSQLTPLLGRALELAALGTLADNHRLLSLIGAGGIGKTLLASHLLRERQARHRHGVCLADLSRVPSGDAVVGAVTAALGVPQTAAHQPLPALVKAVASLDLLLALDNAEHLVESVATLCAALLEGAPRVRLLVTSQRPLRLPAERVYRLGALGMPDAPAALCEATRYGAIALFVDRAQALDQRFALTEANLPQVIDICRRLDGSPLAIELAASRVPLFGPGWVLNSLGQRLQLLTSGYRGAEPRHRTLRSALEWSHGLLQPAEQLAFWRLSVFVGSASLASALDVLCASPGGLDRFEALDALGVLVDMSMVELVEGPEGPDDAPRYRLLDTPLHFAREKAEAAGESASLRQHHALALRRLLEAARTQLFDGDVRHDLWRRRLAVEADDAMAAVHWAVEHDAASALALAPVLSRLLRGRRHAECRAMWERVEPLLDRDADAPDITHLLRARAGHECATFWTNHRIQRAMARAAQAAEWARMAGDQQVRYLALCELAFGQGASNDVPALRETLAELTRLKDPAWSPFVDAVGCDYEFWIHELTGDVEGTLRAIHSQAQRSKAAGIGELAFRSNIAVVLLSQGRLHEAIEHAEALRGRDPNARARGVQRYVLNVLIRAYLELGETVPARAAAIECWPLVLQHDFHAVWADAVALLALQEGRPDDTLRLIGYADAALARAGKPRQPSEAGRADRAERLAHAALAAAHDADACLRLKAEGARLDNDGLTRAALGATLVHG